MEKKYIKFNSFVNFKQSKKNIDKKNTEERIVNIYKKDYFLYKLTEYKKRLSLFIRKGCHFYVETFAFRSPTN